MGELFDISTRLVVHAVDVGIRDEFAEVLVSFEILGDDPFVVDLEFGKILRRGDIVFGNVADVVGPLAFPTRPLVLFVVVDVIEFAAYERLYVRLLAGAVEVDGSEKIAVVGHGQGWHAQLFRSSRRPSGFRTPVEERVVRVIVKMNKRTGRRHCNTVKTGSSSIQSKEAPICSQVVDEIFCGCSQRCSQTYYQPKDLIRRLVI